MFTPSDCLFESSYILGKKAGVGAATLISHQKDGQKGEITGEIYTRQREKTVKPGES